MTKELQDLAWSCLPKKFKEEVKKEYKHQISIDNEQAYWMLERMFGIHNLTSDAEGEEMLTVSRKKVQDIYAQCEEIEMDDNPNLSADIVGAAGAKMGLLEDLFGSKCLPDEKDDCKKFTKKLDDTLEGEIKEPFKEWRDKKYSNVEKLEKNREVEPKAAEPKFKVGDRVIDNENGRKGVVIRCYPNCYIVKLDDVEFPISYTEEALNLYTEPTDNKAEEIADKALKPVEEHFDNILKDGFSKERRLNIAAMIAQGIMANPSPQMVEMDVHRVADLAILMTDTLIAEVGKGDKK